MLLRCPGRMRPGLHATAPILPLSTHRQHDPKPCSSADHLVVGLSDFLDRIALDHRTNAAERTEPQRVLGVFSGAGGPALDGLASSNQLERRDAERFEACSYNQELSISRQTVD